MTRTEKRDWIESTNTPTLLQSWRTMQARLEEEHRSREEEAARVDRVEHRVS